MTKESVRKCSHCGHNGHNSRTCNGKGGCFKLFGVKINVHEKEDDQSPEKKDESIIRKSKSMGNLQACSHEHNHDEAGYLSDGLIQSERGKAAHERKKGVPWTEDEHRSFLVGLKKLGKGDWRGISKQYVPTWTPTQVASHAQKYFIRMAATERKKRRSSLFDMPLKESVGTAAHIAHIATSERPPLSPVARIHGKPDFHRMPYMVGLTGPSFAAAKYMPTVSFAPVLNFPNPAYVYVPHSHGSFATCGPFVVQPSIGPTPQPPIPQGQPQAGPPTSVTKKDGLEAGIGALSI
ncbi:hypothetical protein RJ639_041434 [Escallonia herrerae]|uniref:Uncharacterized protein n=1 Tax=Escallonia herrerae TaxID=1293975 RepID=A0AA88WFZ6_9ASTE|nr:hypothetical protein RJ639_041434 [Escallonia herrerae]